MSDALGNVPLWGSLMPVVALLWLAMEGGYRLGRWRHARWPTEKDQPVGAMVGSILGLLALVLGFTFSLAASRFEARRQAVLDEANAIGTTYLRAKLLPEPQRSHVAQLLREYVDVRLHAVERNRSDEGIARSEALHRALWGQATAAATSSSSFMTGLFIRSLNEVIDLHARRIMIGIRSRIPAAVWATLTALTMIGMVAVGYQSGLAATTRSPAMAALALAFAVVLLVIAELDRGQRGLLRVSQQSLIDVRRSMASN